MSLFHHIVTLRDSKGLEYKLPDSHCVSLKAAGTASQLGWFPPQVISILARLKSRPW